MSAELVILIVLAAIAAGFVLADAIGRNSDEAEHARNLPAGIQLQREDGVGYLVVPRSISTNHKEFQNGNPTIF